MFEQDTQALYFGVTPLENLFLSEYMPGAKGDYVKVYLMGLYHSQRPDEHIGVPELARELDMSESDVEAAMRYWERRGLVALIKDEPPRYRYYCVAQRVLTGQDQAVRPDEKYVEFAESVYALFGDRRKVRPPEIALAYEWVQDVGLTPEVVLMLLNHMLMTAGAQFSFKRAQTTAVKMKEAGVATCEDAESFLRFAGETEKGAQAVLRRMGKRRAPGEDELALYKKWRQEWTFAPEAILSACAAMTAGDPSFKYLDGILERLHTDSAARTGAQVENTLRREEDESARVRSFKDALGIKATLPAILPVYRAMAQKMPPDVILLAAGECGRAGVHTLDSVQRLLDGWTEKGLITLSAAQEYVRRLREQNLFLQKLYDLCGHTGRPAAADREMLEAWRQKGAQDALILYAAGRAASAEGAKMRYINKVLESWLSEGIRTPDEARARDKTPLPRAAAPGKTVSAQRYAQREYTDEELEKAAGTDELLREASLKNERKSSS